MEKTIIYNISVPTRVELLDIKIDERFYEHHGRTKNDWELFLDKVKQLPFIYKKKLFGNSLNVEEKMIYEIYFGAQKPRLYLENDGKIHVNDGRHRMQALKELGIEIDMEVSVCADLELIKNIDDLYVKKNYILFEKTTDEISPDISYLVIDTTLLNLNAITKNDYSFISIKDRENEDYVLISRHDIDNHFDGREFKIELKKLQKHDINIFKTNDVLNIDRR